ncbi:MAG: sulfur carrier protein ThiS adenylyltransferase ThiF [Anaerovoracaceae bacterium]|nr:sulfur carrier protein ThiS adenylyltransferase ThiF [Anaerovoracaceae bacterium]
MHSNSITLDSWRNALAEKQGNQLQERFMHAHVAICGAGGLGSNIAVHLARAGVGHLHIIDFDKVEITNLNRQYYFADQIGMPKVVALKENLSRITPYCNVTAEILRIDETSVNGLFKNESIVCEAFDKAESKAMLANHILENHPGKTLITGSGMAGTGPANDIKTRRISRNFYLCGDESSDVDKEDSLLGTRVAIVAAHQAHLVLQLLTGYGPAIS